jgi:glycosyltransferase involved in cell wall biosynthesis
MGINFKGKFSVLIAVYKNDDPKLFKQALKSIFDNVLAPSKVILVVDGPLTKELDQEIKFYSTSYNNFLVKRLQSNVGLAAALNEGLKLVKTEWVARADSDDFNHPLRFKKQAEFLHSYDDNLDLFGSGIIEVDNYGNKLMKRLLPSCADDIIKFTRRRNPFNHNTVIYRTQFVISVGGYPSIYLKEDYALWASMIAANARIANSPEVLVDANVKNMIQIRRGGLRYAFSEIALQRHLYRCKIKNLPATVFDGTARAMIFLLPYQIRKAIYCFFLRN